MFLQANNILNESESEEFSKDEAESFVNLVHSQFNSLIQKVAAEKESDVIVAIVQSDLLSPEQRELLSGIDLNSNTEINKEELTKETITKIRTLLNQKGDKELILINLRSLDNDSFEKVIKDIHNFDGEKALSELFNIIFRSSLSNEFIKIAFMQKVAILKEREATKYEFYRSLIWLYSLEEATPYIKELVTTQLTEDLAYWLEYISDDSNLNFISNEDRRRMLKTIIDKAINNADNLDLLKKLDRGYSMSYEKEKTIKIVIANLESEKNSDQESLQTLALAKIAAQSHLELLHTSTASTNSKLESSEQLANLLLGITNSNTDKYETHANELVRFGDILNQGQQTSPGAIDFQGIISGKK